MVTAELRPFLSEDLTLRRAYARIGDMAILVKQLITA